jgi:hypothetical protein
MRVAFSPHGGTYLAGSGRLWIFRDNTPEIIKAENRCGCHHYYYPLKLAHF